MFRRRGLAAGSTLTVRLARLKRVFDWVDVGGAGARSVTRRGERGRWDCGVQAVQGLCLDSSKLYRLGRCGWRLWGGGRCAAVWPEWMTDASHDGVWCVACVGVHGRVVRLFFFPLQRRRRRAIVIDRRGQLWALARDAPETDERLLIRYDEWRRRRAWRVDSIPASPHQPDTHPGRAVHRDLGPLAVYRCTGVVRDPGTALHARAVLCALYALYCPPVDNARNTLGPTVRRVWQPTRRSTCGNEAVAPL